MMKLSVSIILLFALAPLPLAAAEISTHVLDLARGIGGAAVPVTLSKRDNAGARVQVGAAATDANGRIRSFGDARAFPGGVYRLQFDMTLYPDVTAVPFFPEITLTFSVSDPAAHYHVPVVVSPYGYSTYRGN